jgi:hypothetical protein
MATDADPIVGNWYEHLDKDQRFDVVKLDEDKRVVEIQYFGGDLDEMELDEWYGLNIEPIEAPEEWTGAVNNIEQDDLGYTETEMAGEGSHLQRRVKPRRVIEKEAEEEDE